MFDMTHGRSTDPEKIPLQVFLDSFCQAMFGRWSVVIGYFDEVFHYTSISCDLKARSKSKLKTNSEKNKNAKDNKASFQRKAVLSCWEGP